VTISETRMGRARYTEFMTLPLWPRETIVSLEIDANGGTVWIDIDLPEIEDLPQRVASMAASGKRLNIKDKAQKQLRVEYATHVHGIALRLAGAALAPDHLLRWAHRSLSLHRRFPTPRA